MLIGYLRMTQEGIEPIADYSLPIKDEKTAHCFFDNFRVALKYSVNESSQTSGIGSLIFAPNGLLWTQLSIHCDGLDEFASYYYSIEQVLEEAKKSRARDITIYVDNKEFVNFANQENPYRLKEHNDVHNYAVEKLKEFGSYKFEYRNAYPKSVGERLQKQAEEASEEPIFDSRGRWLNQHSKPYFNIIPNENDEKLFAEQWARMWLDYIKNYFKEHENDYGKERTEELIKKIKNKEIKDLPDVKRVKENKRKKTKVLKYSELKKIVTCQKCSNEMRLEHVLRHYPEKELHYYFRCNNCKASQELNEKGRVLAFGKYPKVKVNS